MRRIGIGSVLTVSAASAMLLLGSGVAQAGGAPNVVGQKYSDAQSAISGAGFTAVVSTVVGDQKSWPDCMVANQGSRTVPAPVNSSGSAVNQVLVSLNCYASEASGLPGYSAASPEGKAIAAAAASSSAAAAASASPSS
jgi:hypothetical protein